jgi:lipopolysaccharide/colanic/teichoic acid biosynthesis glycosyltransferase
MSAHDLGMIDPEVQEWIPLPSAPLGTSLHRRRDSFGRPVKEAIRLEEPSAHSTLRLVSHRTETVDRAAELSLHGAPREHWSSSATVIRPRQLPLTDCRPPKTLALAAKRCIDLVLGGSSLLVLSPVFAAIALGIKMQSDGPVFYASERVGVHGKIFRCFKFRTMVRDAESQRERLAHLNEREGILFKISNDPRVTRLGARLRKYSLDELPQLINVLRGEMSLVGTRPSLHHEVMQYEDHHLRRLSVVPGMTGLWQVEARSDPSFDSYVELDCKYAETWSVWLDLTILARTLPVVFRGTGV